MSAVQRVSVIVRAFNEAKHISRCFETIVAQRTTFPVEIILVDSGSDDGTVEIAKQFGVTILHISPDEFSFGRSLNLGIEHASGDVCAVISAHCYPVDEHWLETLVAPFADDRIALAYGKQRGNEVTKFAEHRVFSRWFPDVSTPRQTHSFCNNANSAVRRSVWLERPFDETISGLEDIDWAEHALKRGYFISYAADACVIHVHEESNRQIFRRYEREALGIRRIYPDAKFSLWDFIHLFVLNTLGDYRSALRQRVFWKNVTAIPTFRGLQFWGTYKAHRVANPLDKKLRYQLYYPSIFGRNIADETHAPELPTPPAARASSAFVDISRPLHPELPVWPGSKPFVVEWTKRFSTHGVNESHISLNTHTGTHMDAPYHFVDSGKKLHEVSLDTMIGAAHVVEHSTAAPIDAADLDRAGVPSACRRLLLKTVNSARAFATPTFDPSFVALTPAAAQWIVDRGVKVVGIDGCSIQQFAEKTNETHRILLENDVVILEGLDLRSVEPGAYHLVALPLNIPGAEGAPIRAILSRAPLAATNGHR